MINLRLVADALRANRVDLYLQPVVTLAERKPIGYECFTRIRDGDGRVCRPVNGFRLRPRPGCRRRWTTRS